MTLAAANNNNLQATSLKPTRYRNKEQVSNRYHHSRFLAYNRRGREIDIERDTHTWHAKHKEKINLVEEKHTGQTNDTKERRQRPKSTNINFESGFKSKWGIIHQKWWPYYVE